MTAKRTCTQGFQSRWRGGTEPPHYQSQSPIHIKQDYSFVLWTVRSAGSLMFMLYVRQIMASYVK